MDKRTFKKGAALWKQGDPAKTIGIVENGNFGVLRDGSLTGLLWKGMVVGDPDAGAIRPGARADLVAFAGDPTERIAHLSRVAAVWCRGAEIDLAGLGDRADELFPSLSPSPLDDIAARRFVPATAG